PRGNMWIARGAACGSWAGVVHSPGDCASRLWGEGRSEGGGRLFHGRGGGRDDSLQAEEPVDEAVVAAGPGLHAGLLQGPGIGLALVAQRVVLGGEDEGGGEARQIGRVQRRDQRILGVGVVSEVVALEP